MSRFVEVSKNASDGAMMVDRGVGGETGEFLDSKDEVGTGAKHDVHQRANSALVRSNNSWVGIFLGIGVREQIARRGHRTFEVLQGDCKLFQDGVDERALV